MQFLGHLGAIRWPVSQMKSGVDLRFEHLSPALWMDDALILLLFLLSLEIVIDLGLLRQPHKDLAFCALVML